MTETNPCRYYGYVGLCSHPGISTKILEISIGKLQPPSGIGLELGIEETGEIEFYCDSDPKDYDGQAKCDGYESKT